ncbi:MAG: ABC transporter permease [Deinococcus sp.]|nr:ABC transporter permease [Deinococcus sp.]MCL5965413.1 ABC transporter permease [Deinococcus sp.]
MAAYILRRFIHLIPTFIGATLLSFIIIQLAPGDFLTQRELDPNIQPESIARLRAQFGLDQPTYVQYVLWMENLLKGNLGYSFSYQQEVFGLILPRILNSLYIVSVATILLWVIAIPVGIYGAVRQYSVGDRVVSFLAYVGLAVPSFFLSLIAIYIILQVKFKYGIQPFPVGGMTSSGFEQLDAWAKFQDIARHLVVPALVAVSNDIAGFSRLLRGQMLEALGQDYIRTARSKGLAERTVIYKHALRNAIVPFIASIGGLLPGLISGAGLVEVVMNWPGVTPFYLDSLANQDLYVLSGFLSITLALLMLGNLISDFLLAWVDPRIRYY